MERLVTFISTFRIWHSKSLLKIAEYWRGHLNTVARQLATKEKVMFPCSHNWFSVFVFPHRVEELENEIISYHHTLQIMSNTPGLRCTCLKSWRNVRHIRVYSCLSSILELHALQSVLPLNHSYITSLLFLGVQFLIVIQSGNTVVSAHVWWISSSVIQGGKWGMRVWTDEGSFQKGAAMQLDSGALWHRWMT